jgi:hypothetical protein
MNAARHHCLAGTMASFLVSLCGQPIKRAPSRWRRDLSGTITRVAPVARIADPRNWDRNRRGGNTRQAPSISCRASLSPLKSKVGGGLHADR